MIPLHGLLWYHRDMKKIVFTDIDGTLLNTRHELTARTKAALEMAEACGITIALCSGRAHDGLLDITDRLSFTPYLVTLNGAYIIDDAELERVKRSYPVIWKDPAAAPQLCFVGCPHLTLEQLKDWTAKLTDALRAQNRLQVAVPTVFTAAPAVLDAFRDTVEGYKLQSMGVILSYICPLMYMNNPLCKKKAVITNSNKLRTYTSARYYTDAEILDILAGKEGH